MGLIDTYHIATMGQNSVQTYTLASNGILIKIKIDDVIKPPGGGNSGGYIHHGLARRKRRDHEERNKVKSEYEKCKEKRARGEKCDEDDDEIVAKRVTVSMTINNKEYTKTKIVEDIPNLKVSDVKVEVTDRDTKPKIKITISK